MGFDPTDSAASESFRNAHRIDGDITIVGPWNGKLNNEGEAVTLMRPLLDGGDNYYAIEDQVKFDDESPWPIEADGLGRSIERIDFTLFGNDPLS